MADETLTFAGYAGSLRKNSYNRMLLRALAQAAPAGITIRELDISDVPLYNMDLEENPPSSVTRLREEIRRADGLLIVTPEHNGTIPAVTKVVIEWASRPSQNSALEGKPAAIAGASTGYYGTVRAQAALRQIATIEEVYFMIDPELRVGRAAEKFDAHGELIDAGLKAELTAFIDAFANWTRTIKNRLR
jgi:chromate reductase